MALIRCRPPAVWIAACAAATIPAAVTADSSLYVTPSFSVGRAHDDNLFSTPTNTQADSLWRFSPALEAGYESESLTVAGYYTFDAERYSHHNELDSNEARRSSAVNLRYQAMPRLTLAFEGDYTSTNSLAEFAPGTIVEPGREHARVLTLTPSLRFQFDELTAGSAAYTSSRQELFGSPDTDINTAALGLKHEMSRLDALAVDFTATHYDFGLGGTVESRVLTAGWTRALTPETSVSLAAGPRDTEGSKSTDVSTGLQHTLENGRFTLNYIRTQTAVVGQASTVDSRSISAMLDFTFNVDYEAQILPSYTSDTSQSLRADVTRLDLNLGYKLNKDISLVGSYQFNRQRGLLGGIGNPEILDHVFYLGLVFSFPKTTGNFMERHSSPFETLWPSPRH